MVKAERPTFSGAVPTIWTDMLRYSDAHDDCDLSSLRMIICGGSAVPRSLMERFEEKHDVRIVQAWGMTETSPLAAVAHPPATVRDRRRRRRSTGARRTGRVVGGVELRIVDDDGKPLPWDGEAVGEIEVRGPWITASILPRSGAREVRRRLAAHRRCRQVDANGYVQITDRAKDVIKSGGEWISSVELENQLMAHPDVREASVIGVPDPRWDERPLACVVLKDGIGGRTRRSSPLSSASGREVAVPETLELHRRGAEDVGRQVRQEGAARPARAGRVDGAAPRVIT